MFVVIQSEEYKSYISVHQSDEFLFRWSDNFLL